MQDDPDARSWGGEDLFDVYSQSSGIALDGTRYTDW
jgi:general secretion pathway protein G